ncbi:unnamed protein product, partial [Laminaria digitata]
LHKLETIPAHEEGSPALSLPGPNPFVPSEFGLRADDDGAKEAGQGGGGGGGGVGEVGDDVRALLPASIPPLALETGAVIVWHKMDRSYRVPRSAIVAKLWTPEPYGSPEGAALSRMFVRLLREDLKSWAYDAALADLRYSLEMTTHGLQLSVGGFSSKV